MVITQLRFNKVDLMYHKVGVLSVYPKTLSATLLMLLECVVYKPHLAPFKL